MPIRIERSIVYAKRLLLLLISTQILVGLALLIVSEYFKHTLLQHLPVAELSIEMHVICIQFYGVHIIVHYVFGYPLVRRCSAPVANAKDYNLMVRLWHVFVVLVSLDGMLVWYMWSRSELGLTEDVEQVMMKGVDRYYVDPEWRLHWDEYQLGDQCCGVRGFEDWLSGDWRKVQNEEQLQDGILEEFPVSWVPYSCCKKSSDCYLDRVPGEIQTWTEMQNISTGSINTNGCLDVFSYNFKVYAKLLGGIVIAVICLQIVIVIVMRFLRIATQMPVPTFTIDQQSQTEIPTGQPLRQSTADPNVSKSASLFNSNDSVRIIYENETTTNTTYAESCRHGTEIEEIVMQKRVDGEYFKVSEKPRRVRYSELRNEGRTYAFDEDGDRQPLLGSQTD